jgi:RNA polymerase sigma factor (sigma-70 family)
MNTDTEEAWAFVSQNLSTIKRVCQSRRNQKAYIDADELVQQVCLLAVENFHKYDPSRGQPSAWLFWMARSATKTAGRKAGQTMSLTVDVASEQDDYSRFEVSVDFEKLRALASQPQREAIDSYVEELSSSQIQERLGIGLHARNLRLRNFFEDIRF